MMGAGTKVLLAAVVVATAAVVVVGLGAEPAPPAERAREPSPSRTAAELAKPEQEVRTPEPFESEAERARVPLVEQRGTEVDDVRSKPARTGKERPRRRAKKARRRAVAPRPASRSVGEETRMLSAAESALRKGSVPKAQAALATYFERFPSGLMRAEAEALRLVVACRARHAEGVTEARAYLEDAPNGRFAARIRKACRVESQEAPSGGPIP